MFKILLKRCLSGLLHEAGLHLLFVSDFPWYLLRWIFEPALTATLNTITENGKMDGENIFWALTANILIVWRNEPEKKLWMINKFFVYFPHKKK